MVVAADIAAQLNIWKMPELQTPSGRRCAFKLHVLVPTCLAEVEQGVQCHALYLAPRITANPNACSLTLLALVSTKLSLSL